MRNRRLLIGSMLVIILCLLMTYSSLDYTNHDPGIKYILQNYDAFYNTKITFDGIVSEVDEINHEISIPAPERPWLIWVKIPNDEELPEKGDIVEVYGVLDGEGHVTAVRTLASKQWEIDLIYFRSLPAIPFAFLLFFRAWRFNLKRFMFIRRKRDA